MKEELRRILDLVEQKTLTAAQAAELLEAMGLEDEAKEQPKPQPKRALRIIILSADGEKVNLKLPISLLRSGLDIGKHFKMASGGNQKALKDIDWEQIQSMISQMTEDGTTGEMININSANGDKVLILLE